MGIKCTFEIPDTIPSLRLSAVARRNTFLVVKETLHNIVKHSEASVTRIEVEFIGPRMLMRIEDDGRGFDATSPRFGNGLRNMEKRMNDIGGTWQIRSGPGHGTTVTLSIGN